MHTHILRQAISIHAPREGSDAGPRFDVHRLAISIHAPREGSDEALKLQRIGIRISIHAPREGSDTHFPVICSLPRNFNPRSP